MTVKIISGKLRTILLEFPTQKKFKKIEEREMKKTIDLLNEVVAMGFDREQALADIDASLDSELEERKPLMEEEIPESLYDDILEGFRADKEMNV
nr:MAG TPA: UBA-like domain protein [Caudoviricetes sp.]